MTCAGLSALRAFAGFIFRTLLGEEEKRNFEIVADEVSGAWTTGKMLIESIWREVKSGKTTGRVQPPGRNTL